jgi:hypothetical protein
MKKKVYAWCCFVDKFIFDGDFETEELANIHAQSHNRKYLGYCSVKGLTKKEFNEMLGFTEKCLSNMELAKGMRALTVRTSFVSQ